MSDSFFGNKIRIAILLTVAGWGIFSLFAWDRIGQQSTDPHFVLLAESFLNGRLDMVSAPPHRNDWASYREITTGDGSVYRGNYLNVRRPAGEPRLFRTLRGESMLLTPREVESTRTKHFVSFPPFPALLMTPLVAVFGTTFNDTLFTVILAGINIGLVFLALRKMGEKGLSKRSAREDTFLAMIFGFGTVHLWCSVLGQVWFTALVVGVGLSALYVLACLEKKPLLAGLALAFAMATRPHLAFSAVFFALPLLAPGGRLTTKDLAPRLRSLLLFALPILLVGVGLMVMNYVRFENPFEFGHRYLAAGNLPRIRDIGLFSPRFLNRNLAAAFTLVPHFQSTFPYVQVSTHGMSLFLTTPVFLYLLWPRERSGFSRLLWVTVAVLAIPQLFYQNTGYEQFGYRFSLDYTVYLIMLLAVGGVPINRRFVALAMVGMVVNAFGAVTFKRMPRFYTNRFMDF